MPPEVKQQVQPLPGGVLVSGPGGFLAMNQGLSVTAPIRCLAVDLDGNLYAGTATEGVFRSTDGGASWKPARRGLPQLDVQTLVVTPDGSLFAGSSAGGVHRSTDHAEIWEPANGSTLGIRVRRAWRPLRPEQPVGGTLPATTVRSLAAGRWNDRTVLFAGTDSGVFQSRDAGKSWQPANRDLPGTVAATGLTDLVIHAVALGPAEEMVYAGTARGVFRSADGGGRWATANKGIPASDPFTGLSSTEVLSLVSYRDQRQRAHHLLAGTTEGLFRSSDGGASWQPSRQGLGTGRGPVEVLSLAVLDDPVTLITRVYAGTAGGLWSSLDHGASWTAVALPPGAPARVEALAVGPGGTPVLAATPFGSFGNEWPGFRLQGNVIDLDGVVLGVVAGSWIALRPGDAVGQSTTGIYRIRRVSTVPRRDFGLSATITRLEVERPGPLDLPLAGFDLRQTRAYLQSEPLALRPLVLTAVPASLTVLRGALLSFGDLSRQVIVTGKTLEKELLVPRPTKPAKDLVSWLAEHESVLAPYVSQEVVLRLWKAGSEGDRPLFQITVLASDLMSFEMTDQGQTVLQVSDPKVRIRLAKVLVPEDTASSELTLSLSLASRTDGLSLTAGALAESADATPRSIGPVEGDDRVVFVVEIPRGNSGEVLELDLATLQIYGNVVPAAEGQTVAGEVLGDGDASQPNQLFQLAQPLAYLPGEPPALYLSVMV